MNIGDYFHDIAIGITGVQTIDNGRYTTLKQTGRIKATPKTDILNHIHSIVEPTLNQIHKDFSWQYEYKHYGDACIIELDSNKMKVNKKYLKELYSKKLISISEEVRL
jgi:hypothetical protein